MTTYGQRLQLLIDATYATQEAEDGMRTHLGASVIGDPCMRALWYGFRWVASEQWEGRMLRLVHRGQREETVFKNLLERLGARVFTEDSGGNQFRVSYYGGHFGGSTDGVATGLPELTMPVALEMKTHNLRHFTDLKAKGVLASHPKHYRQAQVYMHGLALSHCLYMAVCKNDDELYLEFIDYSPATVDHMLARAETVIFGSGIPARISENSSWYECKFCDCRAVCFKLGDAQARVNCRTCAHSKPERDGTWSCAKGRSEITTCPKVGCDSHIFMEELR